LATPLLRAHEQVQAICWPGASCRCEIPPHRWKCLAATLKAFGQARKPCPPPAELLQSAIQNWAGEIVRAVWPWRVNTVTFYAVPLSIRFARSHLTWVTS